MEIKQGYTLSQMWKKIYSDKTLSLGEMVNYFNEWDEFLDMPLKKEMFVNPIQKPKPVHFKDEHGIKDVCAFDEAYEKWQEAENKVIFDGWVAHDEDYYVLHEKNPKRVLSIVFDDEDVYLTETNDIHTGLEISIETIGDLFQATGGELKIKNVRI
jgi:hypothetical protein